MVEMIIEDDTFLIGMSTIRDYATILYALRQCGDPIHVSGKATWSITDFLEQLGLCGVFHDLGKVEIPTN